MITILKIHNSHANPQSIETYLKYDKQGNERYDKSLSFGQGCDVDHFADDFNLLRESEQKRLCYDERKYRHIIMSCDKSVPTEEVSKMAKEFCENSKISCYQYAAIIHSDTESHCHAHIVVSNIAIKSNEEYKVKEGNSFQISNNELKQMKELKNRIYIEHGHFHSVTKVESNSKTRLTKEESELIKKGEIPWKDKLRYNIADASLSATSTDEFKEIMKEKYHTDVIENKKGEYKYIPESFEASKSGDIKSCHERRLGEDYKAEKIQEQIQENLEEQTKRIEEMEEFEVDQIKNQQELDMDITK